MWKIIVNSDSRGAKLIAKTKITAGDIIFYAENPEICSSPTYKTIQIDHSRHLLHEDLAYLNHSCQPNTLFNTRKLELTALIDISPEEELTFFYPSTEWDMARPFKCQCQTSRCIGHVAGAIHMQKIDLEQYELSPYIQSKLGEL